MGERTIEERLRRLEDREELRHLIAMYGFAVDERERNVLRGLFVSDAHVETADGAMHADGIDAVMASYEGRFDVLGPTNHVSQSMVVHFDGADAARGVVNSHAEVVRHGVAMVAALRYHDAYRREHGHWKFERRVLTYMYFAPAAEYPSVLSGEDRILAYEQPRPADWPEVLRGASPKWVADFAEF
jgi:hypothetical protein